MTLYDWLTEPEKSFRCIVTRSGRYLDYYGYVPARRETHTIKAANADAARRVADYHFLFSIIHLIEEIPEHE